MQSSGLCRETYLLNGGRAGRHASALQSGASRDGKLRCNSHVDSLTSLGHGGGVACLCDGVGDSRGASLRLGGNVHAGAGAGGYDLDGGDRRGSQLSRRSLGNRDQASGGAADDRSRCGDQRGGEFETEVGEGAQLDARGDGGQRGLNRNPRREGVVYCGQDLSGRSTFAGRGHVDKGRLLHSDRDDVRHGGDFDVRQGLGDDNSSGLASKLA